MRQDLEREGVFNLMTLLISVPSPFATTISLTFELGPHSHLVDGWIAKKRLKRAERVGVLVISKKKLAQCLSRILFRKGIIDVKSLGAMLFQSTSTSEVVKNLEQVIEDLISSKMIFGMKVGSYLTVFTEKAVLQLLQEYSSRWERIKAEIGGVAVQEGRQQLVRSN